ncbi:MAG: DJ-1/PfpI family protein [Odoribacteraceae bacterium]|jgi:4-methyl-5(b-hydroxyethyl)-thiazole monophosphate biosynthesis|nr:DJ-1/PfpI family protein [Odoribacteraceae bacterium]
MKKSFLFLADGFEEIEAIATIDVLRRGEVALTTVSIYPERLTVTGAHGVTVTADTTLEEVAGNEARFLILPGGMPGAKNLGDTPALIEWLQHHAESGGEIAAICAAPAVVLSKLRVPRPLRLTCYPGFESLLSAHRVVTDGVAIDDHFITARGPGFAVTFGIEIVAKVHGRERAGAVGAGMLVT